MTELSHQYILDAALERHRVRARGHVAQALADQRPLAEAIAARTDTDRDTGLGPEVLAAAVSAAARVAAQRWLQPEPDTRFSVMLQDALTWIAPALRAADH